MAKDEAGKYANIREILGHFIGKTIEDITQHDKDEWETNRDAYVMLMFSDGAYLKFPVGDEGFYHGGGVNDQEPPEDKQKIEH